MSVEFVLWLGAAIFAIAVMSLASVAPPVIKPTALALNILVASIACWHFLRAGHFAWRTF
jgi:uncharacterized protein